MEFNAQIVRSENIKDWKPLVERIVYQASYRLLGMVSLPCGIDIVSKCIDELCKEGKGEWKWLLSGRLLIWYDAPIDGAMKIYTYVYGPKIRQKNTIFYRVGGWRMWVLETSLRAFDKTAVGRILARIG